MSIQENLQCIENFPHYVQLAILTKELMKTCGYGEAEAIAVIEMSSKFKNYDKSKQLFSKHLTKNANFLNTDSSENNQRLKTNRELVHAENVPLYLWRTRSEGISICVPLSDEKIKCLKLNRAEKPKISLKRLRNELALKIYNSIVKNEENMPYEEMLPANINGDIHFYFDLKNKKGSTQKVGSIYKINNFKSITNNVCISNKDCLNDIVFNKYINTNQTEQPQAIGRLGELAFAKLYPNYNWLNKEANKDDWDFVSQNRKNIDVKATLRIKDGNLSVPGTHFEKTKDMADEYHLICINKAVDNYECHHAGFMTKEQIMKLYNEGNFEQRHNKFYFNKKYLNRMLEI